MHRLFMWLSHKFKKEYNFFFVIYENFIVISTERYHFSNLFNLIHIIMFYKFIRIIYLLKIFLDNLLIIFKIQSIFNIFLRNLF